MNSLSYLLLASVIRGRRFNFRFALLILAIILSLFLLLKTGFASQEPPFQEERTRLNQMIMPFSAKVHITINNAVTNSCDGDFGISSPEDHQLVQNYNSQRGETVIVGPYNQGDELIFYIEPHSFCSGYRYESTNPDHARVHEITAGIWRIEWEDLPDSWPPDNDFDDLIVTIRIAGAYPDYKQNEDDWADDPYDHLIGPYDNIGNWGCALTSAANLLAYYGAREIDPGELNTYLINHNGGYTSNGGIYFTAVDDYLPPDSNVAVMDYSRRISSINPNIDFTAEISRSISNTWPVIFEYDMPQSPSGIHFLVATAITETTPTGSVYLMRDPLSSTTSIEQIPLTDQRIISAILYEPSDQLPRPTLTIYGYSPIELSIIDSSGRRLGYDHLNGIKLWEIPDGYYGYEGPYWNPFDDTKTGEVGGALVADLPGLTQGMYTLLVYGIGTGDFTLETFYDHGGGSIYRDQFNGEVLPGTAIAYDLQVASSWFTYSPRFRLDIVPAAPIIHARETTTITISFIDGNDIPIPNETIFLSTTLGTIPVSTTTDSNGVAIVTYYSGSVYGTATITAHATEISTRLDIQILPYFQYVPVLGA